MSQNSTNKKKWVKPTFKELKINSQTSATLTGKGQEMSMVVMGVKTYNGNGSFQ